MYGPHTPMVPSGPTDPNDFANMFMPASALSLPPNFGIPATSQRLANHQAIFSGVTVAQHKEMLARYYGFIAQIDFNIGRVLDRLEQNGQAENTLILFTADHGEFASERGVWTKGAGAREAVSRVPMLARLPGHHQAGSTRFELTSGIDLMPTILECTGAPIPDEVLEEMDGVSLFPMIAGETPTTPWRDTLFGEFGAPFIWSGEERMIVNDQYKLIIDEGFGGSERLYDLIQDPFEINDLLQNMSPAALATRATLHQSFTQWWGDPATHAPNFRTAGNTTSAPNATSIPMPQHGGSFVDTRIDLEWLRSTAADTQTVYLYVAGQAPQILTVLEGPVSTANPGTLDPGTTYQWRVDSTNGNGTTIGPVWTFTTDPNSTAGPALPIRIAPSEGALEAGPTVQFTWQPSPDAASQKLILTSDQGLLNVVNFGSTVGMYQSIPLIAGATYTWRVDTLDAQGLGTEGTQWVFRTDPAPLAGRVGRPRPEHLSVDTPTRARISWTADPDADSYRVHLGTSFPPAFQTDTVDQLFDPSGLQPDTTYYWRVDSVNSRGVQRGWTWRFRTRP